MRIVKTVLMGLVLGFALVGVVASGLAFAGNQKEETSDRVYNSIVRIEESGYYHVRVWFKGEWKIRIQRIDQAADEIVGLMTPGAKL